MSYLQAEELRQEMLSLKQERDQCWDSEVRAMLNNILAQLEYMLYLTSYVDD